MIVVVLLWYMKINAQQEFARNKRKAPYDAIIVPGYPYKGSNWHDIMKVRVLWSKYLYDEHIAKNIIFSGAAVYTPYIESRIMKLYAIELGIPEDHIFTEEKAEHSTENIYYSFMLARDNGFNKIAVATDPFQGAFLKVFNRKKQFNLDFLPVNLGLIKNLQNLTLNIDASSALVNDFQSIKDREGLVKRWKGTLGKNIEEPEPLH